MKTFKTFNEMMDEAINARLAEAPACAKVELVFDDGVETAHYLPRKGAIGIVIRINSAWYATLSDVEKAAVVVHEVNHALADMPTPLHTSCMICN